MSQYVETACRAFTAGAALAQHLRVKLSSGVLAAAGATDVCLGTMEIAALAANDVSPVRLRTAQGTRKMVASEAITAGQPVYAAASGKVASTGTVYEGTALETSTANGDIIEVLPGPNTDISAAITGTTAATFQADSDLGKPRAALGSQTGGTGDFKAVIKPPTTLTADRNFTLVGDADATLATLAAQTFTGIQTFSVGMQQTSQAVNPAADSGAGSTILTGSQSVTVGAVVNDANDWIVLPAIASVPVGHTIRIACNAGGNFEMRTPASSNTKINDVDSDGTQEYLCTDTDLVIVTSRGSTAGWVAQSITKLGAVRTAVVPD